MCEIHGVGSVTKRIKKENKKENVKNVSPVPKNRLD